MVVTACDTKMMFVQPSKIQQARIVEAADSCTLRARGHTFVEWLSLHGEAADHDGLALPGSYAQGSAEYAHDLKIPFTCPECARSPNCPPRSARSAGARLPGGRSGRGIGRTFGIVRSGVGGEGAMGMVCGSGGRVRGWRCTGRGVIQGAASYRARRHIGRGVIALLVFRPHRGLLPGGRGAVGGHVFQVGDQVVEVVVREGVGAEAGHPGLRPLA